ncbi:hypothetical protein HYPSUDRAFT_66808 [Hypholoma sublateritium FD-334 SS-4]|uniref:Cytochrome P450 n=1 Tax=Hypholoma sublateritium (strain FD-334 SS-4) TaxID=945553 RepID=A0A0D2P294_HYPSF|nr:hypothetical protein HYPSUDRAFT_66808 [Hypholoma sublateritium FD-334 SS-4]
MHETLNNLYSSVIPLAVLGVTAFILKQLVANWSGSSNRGPFAPGPKPRFLVGNLYDLPSSDVAHHYAEWGRRYNSDILHASALGNHFMILNSFKDAEELFEKRASKYSDRPIAPVIKLMGWDSNMAFMPLGDEWRRHRRVAQQNLRQDAMVQYYPIQLEKVHRMLQGLLDTPERFDYHNKMLSMSIPMSIMYGHDLKSLDDPFIVAAEESAIMGLKLLQPGYTLINVLPFLRYIPPWFPGAVAQRMAKETKKMADMLRLSPMETVKNQLKEGTALPSMIAKYIEGESGYKEDEDVVGGLAFTVYSGASDTTISATSTLFYLLATHPEVQIRAQKELDSVIGTDRLPGFDDRPYLPFIEAIYREVLRWRPPTMLGLVHRASEDDMYRGYYIPKGTNVFANIWAMAHDEKKYEDPHAFKPERFLDADGGLNDDDRILTYGFGRRICVGKHLASTSMWLTIASILATFTFSKAKDQDGNEIEIKGDFYDSGIITHKNHFQCLILPRSETARRLIQEINTPTF